MSRTPQDMTARAMQLLGLLDAQQEPATEDRAIFVDAYAAKFADLSARDLTYWAQDEIPEEAFEYVCMIMADVNASAFKTSAPVVMDENGQQVAMIVAGLRGIRRLMARQASGLTTQATYF